MKRTQKRPFLKRAPQSLGIAIILALSAPPALADPDLDNFQRLAFKFTKRIGSAIAAQTKGGKTVPPKLAWTPQLNTASTCMLGEFRARIGENRVKALMKEADRFLSRRDLTLGKAQAEAERLRPLPHDQMTEIDKSCGFTVAGLQSLMKDPNFPKFMASLLRKQKR